MGTQLIVLNMSFSMNTNMTGFKRLQNCLHSSAFDESSLSSIKRVNILAGNLYTIDLTWQAHIASM